MTEAERADKERGLPVQAGGSSHGAAEIVYRIHATRLKTLLWAVRCGKEERDAAELEALRITRKHWYREPENKENISVEGKEVRSMIWEVLSDIVAVMAQLRIDHPYFHRSVYRHAQALLWAPVFNDPEVGFIDGSIGAVPVSKSVHLRGLNTGVCAKSAEVIMKALFEKKR